jgi:T-complex protein 1 subunit theta
VERLIVEIAASGATVVVSGGAVGEMAMHYLEKHHIMVVKINRSSIFFFFFFFSLS